MKNNNTEFMNLMITSQMTGMTDIMQCSQPFLTDTGKIPFVLMIHFGQYFLKIEIKSFILFCTIVQILYWMKHVAEIKHTITIEHIGYYLIIL